MPSVRIEIVRYVDDGQPGIVECVLRDSSGRVHLVVDKAPIFTEARLQRDSIFPQAGVARCEVLERSKDIRGRKVARVTIARPDALESVDGISDFVVLESEISVE